MFIVIASIALGVCAFVPEAALANEPTANKLPAMPPNIVSIPPDLVVPPVADGEPDPVKKQNATQWWGDADASADYCVKTVLSVCEQYGGDPQAVVLTGFPRGAIAGNYIGLRNDEIARLWAAFVAHGHYDGVIEKWPYSEADRDSALSRLGRLKGRPVFVSQEEIAAARGWQAGWGGRKELRPLLIPLPRDSLNARDRVEMDVSGDDT